MKRQNIFIASGAAALSLALAVHVIAQQPGRNLVPLNEENLKNPSPNDWLMYKHLAWLEYMGKKPDAARQHLQAGIVNCPDAFELQTALAELLIQGKMFDQVNKIIAELKAKGVKMAFDMRDNPNTAFAFISDNAGNAIELIEHKTPR